MDIEKLIERLRDKGCEDCPHRDTCRDDDTAECVIRLNAATALSTIQDENEKLRAELEQVKRCIEIVEHQRDAAIYDMTALMAAQCCDLCAVEYCNDRGKTEMCTAFKWRGPEKED